MAMAMAMASTQWPILSTSPPWPSCLASAPLHSLNRSASLRLIPRAHNNYGLQVAADSSSDAVASEVGVVAEEPRSVGVPSLREKKVPPLEKGGTLTGRQAEGKDPSPAALGNSRHRGKFSDARWKNGTWDLQQFSENGKVNWDAVIDAEVLRRKWLEENPEASNNEEPVVFETSTIPWWPWVKRFHLPEAELLNGRAAMVGFFMAYLVDSLTGLGLVDQMNNSIGKLLLFIAVVAILLIRKNEDVANLRQWVKEWNFYDKQWQATWEDSPPSSSDKLE